ncbi:hypothetical protein VA7868_00491 [Vibrio aerogenes CECT 7868]|uniref:Capsular biosynthesis protein n=1 Tax=Vibrio aerogenes CECT 7868 TaxID=1216006 RepID=A0A1M5VSS2_9VIBR|nr:capsular biosynthesis protein [Vibrio aerogenes]SHH78306.1 hypothetical protein VA7868_00491 [Vibrio aerogenes CECT 7868]
MSLIKSILTIASSSLMSQIIGALSIWLISHRYGMADVGIYALTYSIVIIGAQLCTFASHLLIPGQKTSQLGQNIVFCLLQTGLLSLIYAIVTSVIFERSFWLIYLLNIAHAWILISENLLIRAEKMRHLAFQRLSVSVLVFASVLITGSANNIYPVWAGGLMILIMIWLSFSVARSDLKRAEWGWKANWRFACENKAHLSHVGVAEVLAIANTNLPTILINFWFSAVTAGYFAVVSRFCLSPVVIAGNAVRNSVFSRWSADSRRQFFNFDEFVKVRRLLLAMAIIATAGIFIFYPLLVQLEWFHQWADSVPTSRYILPYIFPSLAVCPLTILELVFGSKRYFMRIQVEQMLVVLMAFLVLPAFYQSYAVSVFMYALLSALRYTFIYVRVSQRAVSLRQKISGAVA